MVFAAWRNRDRSLNRPQGYQAEQLVARYLEQAGFVIKACNYRLRGGEIDIIAMKADLIAFVEVKWRIAPQFDPAHVIVPRKQQTIITTARHFMATHNYHDYTGRFDVALVIGQSGQETIRYLENAFQEE